MLKQDYKEYLFNDVLNIVRKGVASRIPSILYDIYARSLDMYTPVAIAPTMLSPQEQNFLRLLAQKYYTGEGAIVDAGCCLGGCMQSFARGLSDRDDVPGGAAIHTYELGICTDGYLVDFIKSTCRIEKKIGENFLDILQRNLAETSGKEYVTLHSGDILQQEFPGKIEILFLNVCKTPSINYTMTQLFTRLIPGKSLVIQQEYVHECLPWIHIVMGYLHEYFEPIGSIPYATFAFLLKKPIPNILLCKDLWDTLDISTKIDCFTRYFGYPDKGERLFLELAKARLLGSHGENKEAIEIICACSAASKNLPSDMRQPSSSAYVDAENYIHSIAEHSTSIRAERQKISLATLRSLRQRARETGHSSLTSEKYQEDIAYYVANHADYGDALLEIGCFHGGLTVQLAYMAHTLEKKLYVIDISQENLDSAKHIVEECGFSDRVKFHCMDLTTFVDSYMKKTHFLLAIIDGSHWYPNVVKDCKALLRISNYVHGAIFHDFTLHMYSAHIEQRVNDAIFDTFGSDIPYFCIGSTAHFNEENISKYKYSNNRKNDHFFEGTEGVLIYGNNINIKQIPTTNKPEKSKNANPQIIVTEKFLSVPDPTPCEHVKRLEKEIQDIHHSKSWRITAPLRWIYGRFAK